MMLIRRLLKIKRNYGEKSSKGTGKKKLGA